MANTATFTATFTTAGTYTWVAPAGVTSVSVQCWGGGGGGGGSDSNAADAGGGGGGGEYAAELTNTVVPGDTYTVVVGASSGSAASDQTGTTGGNSTFSGTSATTVTANGGIGGIGGAGSGAGGAGGTGSTNSVHHDGGAGANNVPPGNVGGGGGGSAGPAAAGNAGSGQTGGAAVTGGAAGGNGGSQNGGSGSLGVAGSAPGGGGGGAGIDASNNTGGASAAGQVVITWTMALPATIATNTTSGGGVYRVTAPAGAVTASVQCWGAGGGGGNTPGGGGGEYAAELADTVIAGNTYTFTVGAGGAGSSGAGGAGGSSTFSGTGATTVTANGGAGGSGSSSSAGGTGSTNTVHFNGGQGAVGSAAGGGGGGSAGTASAGNAGASNGTGASAVTGGGPGGAGGASGSAPVSGPGGGGGGASVSTGGAGFDGQITIAFSAAATDVPGINPGPTWLSHFKPGLPKPKQQLQPPYINQVQCSGSLAMAVMQYGAINVIIPQADLPAINPGPTWLAHFKPWRNKPEASAPPSGPWIFQIPSYTDYPQFNPGPTWLAIFKPWLMKRPVAPYLSYAVQNPGSVALAPMAMSGTGTVYPVASGGPQMTGMGFGSGNHLNVPIIIQSASMAMAPMKYGAGNHLNVPVIIQSASMAMAPMHIRTPAFLSDLGVFRPGPTWLSIFKPWSKNQKLKVPGGPSFIGAYGSTAMAPTGIAAKASSNAPFPKYPLSNKVELLINGTWIDITPFVYNRDGIVITRGLPDETQATTPSQMTLTLNNRDGRFSPNNPFGSYYPFLTRNTQCRMSVADSASSTSVIYGGYRFWGEVSSWPPRWDPTQSDVYCQIIVSGPLRRFVQGAKLGSTLYQYYTSLSDNTAPYAYWPCEDGSSATEIASALPSVAAMSFTGKPQFASNAEFGGSDPLPVLAASSWHGTTAAAADPPGTGTINQIYSGTYHFVCPPGVTALTGVVCTGAGGGGGDTDSTTGGGGGGGGGAGKNASVAVTPGTKYTYIVGAGGSTTAGAGGGNGADSTLTGDSVTVTGKGGQGGAYAGAGGTGGAGATYNGGRGADGSAGAPGSGGTTQGGGSQSLYASGTSNTGTTWTAPSDLTGEVTVSGVAGGGGGGGGRVGGGGFVEGGGGGGAGASFSGSASVSPGGTLRFQAGGGGPGGQPSVTGDATAGTAGGYSGTQDGQVQGTGGGGGGGGTSAGGGTAGSGSPSGSPGASTYQGYSGGGPGGGSGYGAGGAGGYGQWNVGAQGGYSGAPGYVTWSWTTSDSFTIPPVPSEGGGGGGSAGSSRNGNDGSGGTGGAAVTGGGAGGSDGPAPYGKAPGGGGAGANPGQNTAASSTAGAGAPGGVTFSWSGGVTSPVAADIIRFCLDVDSAGAADAAILLQALTYGTAATLNLIYHTGGKLELVGLNSSSATVFDSGAIGFSADGQPLYVDIELTSAGSNVNWTLQAIVPGAANVVAHANGSFSGFVGNVSDILVDPAGAITDNATSIGQITVQTYADTLQNMSPIVNGYAGETAAARMNRLCTAQGLGFELVGNASDTPKMGPQQDDTFVNVMQSCADLDRGNLYETRDQFGVGYRTRVSMRNTSPSLSVDYTLATLSGTLAPVADDQFTRNDITVTRNGGASARTYQSSGVMSILTPPNGVGDYTYQLTVQANSDTQLAPLAAWMLNIGTVSEYRYPTIEFDLARTEVASFFAQIANLDIGDFVQVLNPPVFLQLGSINQLCWGFTETLNTYTWVISINTVPQSPWAIVGGTTW